MQEVENLKRIKRGDIYYADLNPVVGSEQGGVRPVLILQNNIGNQHSPTVIAVAITSKAEKTAMPTHITLCGGSCGLPQESIVLLEQVRTLDRSRLRERVGSLDEQTMTKINTALAISMGLSESEEKHDE